LQVAKFKFGVQVQLAKSKCRSTPEVQVRAPAALPLHSPYKTLHGILMRENGSDVDFEWIWENGRDLQFGWMLGGNRTDFFE
jgi:hypothetical protein